VSPDITALVAQLLEFRDARDWKQFHTLKNLVSALSVEAAELLELTQWKTTEELEAALNDQNLQVAFANEIADRCKRSPTTFVALPGLLPLILGKSRVAVINRRSAWEDQDARDKN
jgi:hypothetical protein